MSLVSALVHTFLDFQEKLPLDSDHSSLKSLNNLPHFDSAQSTPSLYLTPTCFLPAPCQAPHKPLRDPPLAEETRILDIDLPSLSLHRALHLFRPVDDRYAIRPYPEAFNWDELILPVEDEREWYCVAFRSVRRQGIDSEIVYKADRLAHEEAVQNGGLILYWYGVPEQETGANLATCIWQSRQHALAANCRPEHIQAAKLAKATYETYELERWIMRKIKGDPRIHLEKYTEGPVGW